METHSSICEFSDFLEEYMPKDGLKAFDSVVSDLEREKVLAPRIRTPARHSSTTEQLPPYRHTLNLFKGIFRAGSAKTNRVIKSLQGLANTVCEALQNVKGLYVNTFSIRAGDSEDGALCEAYLTSNADGILRYTDVVVPLLVTGSKTSGSENDLGSTESLLRVLNGDVRRRFAYAITVHGEYMSLWYISRSTCVKTFPISMAKHPDLLIQVFVCFLSATNEQLGYDPLVTLLGDGSYLYEMPPDHQREERLYYRTVDLVSQLHSDDPTGRSSRVWRVQRVVSATDPTHIPGEPDVILKDVFLDANRQTEADAQEQLFRDLATFSRQPDWRSRPMLKDFSQDDLDRLGHALSGENFKNYFSCIIAKHCSDPTPSDTTAFSKSSAISGKRRCFFVYELVCTPLNDIPTLGEAIDILKQCCTALQLMFCAGWLHGDISAGNILAFKPSPDAQWKVKLSDLEFARRFDEAPPSDELVMGTPHFTACELQTRCYFIHMVRERGMSRRGLQPEGTVVRNFQHDLEAVFWIALWLLTMRANNTPSRRFGLGLFQQRLTDGTITQRANLLSKGNSLSEYPSLPQSLPRPLQAQSAFVGELDALRNNLYVEYINRNGDNRQRDVETYSWIMSEGLSIFFTNIEESREEWAGIELVKESQLRRAHTHDEDVLLPAVSPSMKRKLEESETAVTPQQPVDAAERPRKRLRSTALPPPPRRSGPVTRSMTRAEANPGPMTRSTTRRLQQSTTRGGAARATRTSTRNNYR